MIYNLVYHYMQKSFYLKLASYEKTTTFSTTYAIQSFKVYSILLAQALNNFTLVNAETNLDITTLDDGENIYLSQLPTDQLNIRANSSGNLGSVRFLSMERLVAQRMYLLMQYLGDTGGNYAPWTPDPISYEIIAVTFSQSNGNGIELDRATITITFVAETTTIPSAPINLSGAATAVDLVELAWEDTSNNEDSFVVEYNASAADTGWQILTTLPANTTTYNHNETDTNWERFYRIKAVNNSGSSPYTSILSVANFPVPPRDFVVSAITSSSFDLAWTAAPYGNDYLLESSTISAESGFAYFDALYYGYDEFSYSGLAPGTTYFFRMRTNYNSQASAWSEVFTVTTPAAQDEDGLEVTRLVLVNADTDQDIEQIDEGDIFNLQDIGTSNLNIRADVGSETESVVFGYQDNPNFHIENLAVYAIGGNIDSDYRNWVPDLGENTVTATSYDQNGGNGQSGTPRTVNFQIIDETQGTQQAVVRLNAGGPSITFGEETFLADRYFSGDGKSYSNSNISEIFETDRDEIYLSERSTTANLESFSYNIPVTNGEYTIKLHFAEIYFGATGGGPDGIGRRVFDVSIEGQSALSNFDLNAIVDPMTAVIETFTTMVEDQELTIVLSASVNQPKLAALEVFGEGSLIDTDENCDWNTLADSSLEKVEAQSVKINDKLYVLAGFLSGLNITGTTEIYDPASDSWSIGAPMPTPVTHMGAVGVGNEIWILGGFEGNHPGVATDNVQIYNTATDTALWTRYAQSQRISSRSV